MVRANEMAMLMPKSSIWSKTITVIGTGAVGRQVAVSLAALGAKQLQLIDGDVVRRKHIINMLTNLTCCIDARNGKCMLF